MKRLLIVAVTLSITTGAMAQEGDGREATTRGLKSTVELSYGKVEDGVEAHLPVTIDYARVILSSYEGHLDAKSQAKLDKLVAKERKRFLKGATDQEREYFLAYEAIVSGSHELGPKDFYTASLVYMDFVCQYFKIDRSYDAMFYMTDYLLFSASVHADLMDGARYWKEYYPRRYEYVNEQLKAYDMDAMIEMYLFHFFKEPYSKMSEEDLVEAYISHVEAVVECYERDDRMQAIRHAHAMQVIRKYGNQEALYDAHMAWTDENYEMAVAHHDYIDELFSHE